jgi:hypothetical protein
MIFTYIGDEINMICTSKPVLRDSGIPSHISDFVFGQQKDISIHSPANVKSRIYNQNLLNTSSKDIFNYGNFNLNRNIITWLDDHLTQKGEWDKSYTSHLAGAICSKYFTKGDHNFYFVAENSDTSSKRCDYVS